MKMLVPTALCMLVKTECLTISKSCQDGMSDEYVPKEDQVCNEKFSRKCELKRN